MLARTVGTLAAADPGTTGGVGFYRDPQVFMKPGDVVEVDISEIGVLTNTIVDE